MDLKQYRGKQPRTTGKPKVDPRVAGFIKARIDNYNDTFAEALASAGILTPPSVKLYTEHFYPGAA